jgi:hypothetical protein
MEDDLVLLFLFVKWCKLLLRVFDVFIGGTGSAFGVVGMPNGVAFLYASRGHLKHSVPCQGWDMMPTGLGLGRIQSRDTSSDLMDKE